MIPKNKSYIILFLLSAALYVMFIPSAGIALLLFAEFTAAYVFLLIISKMREKKASKILLCVFAVMLSFPMFLRNMIPGGLMLLSNPIARKLGITIGSFGTGYICFFLLVKILFFMTDVYRGKTEFPVNPIRFIVYASFFPSVLCGQACGPMSVGKIRIKNIFKGLFMIALYLFFDRIITAKLSVMVSAIFDGFPDYLGMYVPVGLLGLYFEIFVRFFSFYMLGRGFLCILGNDPGRILAQPYRSASFREFFARENNSVFSALKELFESMVPEGKRRIVKYICVPLLIMLGGLFIGISGRCALGALITAVLVLAEEIVRDLFTKRPAWFSSVSMRIIRGIPVFILIIFVFGFFRAGSISDYLNMTGSIFTYHNAWIFFNDSLFWLGITEPELHLILISILAIFIFETAVKEKKNEE